MKMRRLLSLLLAALLMLSVLPEAGVKAAEKKPETPASLSASQGAVESNKEAAPLGDTVYTYDDQPVSVGKNRVQAYGTYNGQYMNWKAYPFIPKTSGTYRFYSKEGTSLDFDCALFLPNGDSYVDTLINDTGIGDFNFSYKLTKGVKYYVGVREWSSYSDPYLTLYIEKKGGDSSKKNIKNATIKLNKTKFKYTGKAIKPKVTVKYKGTKLKKGTHYTVTYKDNKNAGTGKVIVKGKGKYTGKKTKKFTITGIKLTSKNTKFKLSKTSYKYDGKAKKPTVTLKYKSKKLKKGTNYTVSYKNNVEPGTATVVVKGKGKYTGTLKKTFKIKGTSQKFKWGTNNWNFTNSPDDFQYADDGYRSCISDMMSQSYQDALSDNLTNEEWEYIFGSTGRGTGWSVYDDWGGSCYGMSSTTLLAKAGLMPYSKYTSGASNLNDETRPVDNMKVSSLISYYQMLQIKSPIQQEYRNRPSYSHEKNIKDMVSAIKKYPCVVIGFYMASGGGHAILITGHESGSWDYYGYHFNRRFEICDPNFSNENYEDAYVYYNTSDYSWMIPVYYYSWQVGSMFDSTFNCVVGTTDDVNYGGYLNDGNAATIPASEYVARLNMYESASNAAVSKVTKRDGNYMVDPSGSADIRKSVLAPLGSKTKATEGYNLADSLSAYQVSQAAGKMSLDLYYQNTLLKAVQGEGQLAVFDKDGVVKVSGQKSAYILSVTSNEDYPTDWFTVKAEGTAAEASLEKAENGYILKADTLKNVTVTVNNKKVTANASFSTKAKAVLIYEIDQNTVGIKADLDSDGTFETEVK